MPEVSVSHLTRSYATSSPAGLFDLSLKIHDGETLAVVGPSGSGKTTLLRLIAGLETPDAGTIEIAGRDVTGLAPHQRDVGILPQHPALYPHLDIRRNLSIGLEMSRLKVDSREIDRRVDEAVQFLGLDSVLDRRPFQLSGGEQQRVALGRLMVRRPSVWLLDEPFGHLDSGRKTEFRRQLHLLRGHVPATILLVTHDPVEAQTLGRRVAVLDSGRLRQVDEPAQIHARPADRFVAAFFAWPAMNFTDGILVRASEADKGLLFAAADGSFRLAVPAELVTHDAAGRPVTVGIRPEDILVPRIPQPSCDEVMALAGWRVRLLEYMPPRWLALLELGNQRWSVWFAEPPAIGDQVELAIPMERIHWFDGRNGIRI
jgi:ABC-type sugar transport system ATPase subunit